MIRVIIRRLTRRNPAGPGNVAGQYKAYAGQLSSGDDTSGVMSALYDHAASGVCADPARIAELEWENDWESAYAQAASSAWDALSEIGLTAEEQIRAGQLKEHIVSQEERRRDD